jgi:DNA-binding SARP family transcriptional activator
MALYQARGLRLLALKAYEKFRNILSADLDTVPDPATTQLYHRLQRNAEAESH